MSRKTQTVLDIKSRMFLCLNSTKQNLQLLSGYVVSLLGQCGLLIICPHKVNYMYLSVAVFCGKISTDLSVSNRYKIFPNNHLVLIVSRWMLPTCASKQSFYLTARSYFFHLWVYSCKYIRQNSVNFVSCTAMKGLEIPWGSAFQCFVRCGCHVSLRNVASYGF